MGQLGQKVRARDSIRLRVELFEMIDQFRGVANLPIDREIVRMIRANDGCQTLPIV